MRDIKKGRWFQVDSKQQHDNLKRYGKLNGGDWSARVQIGEYAGPGQYMLIQYSKRCPRNCCDDDVNCVLSSSEVLAEVQEEMQELASIIKRAKQAAG